MTAQALRWHQPRFTDWQCASGQMTEPERLGLPESLVETDLQQALGRAMRDLRCTPGSTLIAMLADGDAPLAHRIAAGNLLGTAGDPRIDPLAPDMIAIPGGVAEIGLAVHEIDATLAHWAHLGLARTWLEKEAPRHAVALAPYAIARYPVTNGEYRLFLAETGWGELPSSWAFRRYPAERANHPVYTVSARSADAYAGWLAARTGRAFRLPTEAEWEYAAAGPDGREFPWGDDYDPALCNTAECGLFDTSPVGAFVGGEAACGASDMGGNVEEYVADDYAPYPGGTPVDDHLSQIHGRYRIARGGAFSRFADLARTRRRHGHNQRSPAYAMGFRLAESRAP